MIASKTLLITILWIFSFGVNTSVDYVTKDCDSLKVKYAIEQKSGGYSLDLTISGGSAPYKTILSKQNGDLVTEDFSLTRFESLRSGTHTCVVIDSKNCKTKLEITIP